MAATTFGWPVLLCPLVGTLAMPGSSIFTGECNVLLAAFRAKIVTGSLAVLGLIGAPFGSLRL